MASPLNVGQVTRAVDALLKHTRNTKNAGKAQLIESDDPISVLIGMKSIPDTGRRTTPYMMWETLPSIPVSLSLSSFPLFPRNLPSNQPSPLFHVSFPLPTSIASVTSSTSISSMQQSDKSSYTSLASNSRVIFCTFACLDAASGAPSSRRCPTCASSLLLLLLLLPLHHLSPLCSSPDSSHPCTGCVLQQAQESPAHARGDGGVPHRQGPAAQVQGHRG